MQNQVEDQSTGSNFWWGVLSFFFPLVGLILQIVWWKTRHSNAKACMWGWIAGCVVQVVVFFLLPALFAAIAMSGTV